MVRTPPWNKSPIRITSLIVLVICFSEKAFANKEGYYGMYIGKLSQLHHGVSGDVFAVDARTLHLRNFNYDGEGPAAYFYAGNSKGPGVNGFRLRDERGTTNVLPRYRNSHITITLPEGKTLQNIRWFSVWCDEFSVNFGDVKIPRNLDFPKPQKIRELNGVHGVSSEPIVIVDAQTLLIPSFSYDGEAPDAKFWVGPGSKPTPQGIRIPDENGKEVPLRRYDRKTIVLTLPGELTIFDIGHFGVWCEAFTVDFGHVQIPRGLNIPPSLKMLGVSPQKRSSPVAVPLSVQNGFENQFGSRHTIQPHSKLNCEVLWDDFAYEVRWAVAGDSIVLQLVARLENNEYMSFGLSGDKSRSRMVGGDVVVAWVDRDGLKGYAEDYYLDAKSQCSGGRGSCPDENIAEGTSSVRLLNAALVNGYSIVTFQRSLRAQDEFDKDFLTNGSQPIIWAIGPLNSHREVSYHSLTNRGDVFIEFGRPPKWNCPTPESTSEQPEAEEEKAAYGGQSKDSKTQDAKIQDSNRHQGSSGFHSKPEIPTPAPAPKSGAWEIPSIKCYEPEDGVFYAQMGPTGGKHGYSAITGHVGWGISWYINGLLIPEINVVRGRTYTFIVEGGLDPETPARYHPFYITDDPVGGYQYKTPEERLNIQIFAGAVQNKKGEVRPTGIGRLCNWTPDPNQPHADEFASFGAYQRTLRLECDPGNPGIIQWTVDKDTPDTVYYQCYTHRYLGWKINVHDRCENEAAASEPVPSVRKPPNRGIAAADFEESESINYEVRIKADDEFLRKQHRVKAGANQLENAKTGARNAVEKFSSDVEVETLSRPNDFIQSREHFIFRPGSSSQGFARLPPKTENDRQRLQNFTISPASAPPRTRAQGDYQNQHFEAEIAKGKLISQTFHDSDLRKDGEKMGENFFRHHQISDSEAEGEQFKNFGSSRISGNSMVNPSLARGTLAAPQVPSGSLRRPLLKKVPGKRVTATGFPYRKIVKSHRPNHGSNGDYERFAFNEKQPEVKATNPFGNSGARESPQENHRNGQIGRTSGFDPKSIKVEGGFRPILATAGRAQDSSFADRADAEVAEDDFFDDVSDITNRKGQAEEKNEEANSFQRNNESKRNEFPAVEKTIRFARTKSESNSFPVNGDGANEREEPIRVEQEAAARNGSNVGNILELLEMDEDEEGGTAAAIVIPPSSEPDPGQDEIAMADEKQEFYFPPKTEKFLAYDGKVVRAAPAPTFPESGSVADVSKLPQFVPFRGAIPPLGDTVNAKNLPQLKSSKLARDDILPHAHASKRGKTRDSQRNFDGSDAEFALAKVTAVGHRPRRKRSPDHGPIHEHHEHHDHHDHFHSNGPSATSFATCPSASIALTLLFAIGSIELAFFRAAF